MLSFLPFFMLTACAHRPLGVSVVVEPPTKRICASITRYEMGKRTLSSCKDKEWVQVTVFTRGWDAWEEPVYLKVAEMHPCDRYSYQSEQCREAVFAFAAMKVEEAKNR